MVSWYHYTVVIDNFGYMVYIAVMKPAKSMTIRLSADQAEALETVASVEDLPVSEVIRSAIAEHVKSRTKDPAFQSSLRERLSRVQRLLRK
jgi:predicted transcriptional regulator